MALSKKNSLLQVLVLAMFLFSSYCFHMSNSNSNNKQSVASGFYVCKPSDRVNKNCPQYIVQGCVCYTNGKCYNKEVNKCVDCENKRVTKVLEGRKCPVY